MAVTSDRNVLIQFTGDIEYSQTFESEINTSGSGQNQLVSLVSGNNAITIPTGAVAVTVLKSSTNTAQLLYKGVNGDTGIKANLLSPDSFSLSTTSPTLVINSDAIVTVRLIFS